jgi:glycosyltransferase involved in cell wall biosynthesis
MPVCEPAGGGVYQYSQSLLRALESWKEEGCEHEFWIFVERQSQLEHVAGISHFNCALLRRRTLGGIVKAFISQRLGPRISRRVVGLSRNLLKGQHDTQAAHQVNTRPDVYARLGGLGIELMIYPEPTALAFEIGIPYVMAVHDLQHRMQPEFPEVSADGEWERREYRYLNGTQNATAILVDSEVGRQDVLTCYGSHGVEADSVKVLPFLPADYLVVDVPRVEIEEVKVRYQLPGRFLFFPAQLWPHKNHERTITALSIVKSKYGIEVPMVFCGSHTGPLRERTLKRCEELSCSLGVSSQLRFLGYAPSKDMSALYAASAGVVLPTFFGPTNIPILEAWAFGCPVLTSDIRGIREQVGNAGILVDPGSEASIAEGIYHLWTDTGHAKKVVANGRRRLQDYGPSEHKELLTDILRQAVGRLASEADS